MDVEEQVPADLDTLRELIVKRYDSLSGRLQQVADFVMAQPMLVAVETMATIAEQANVPLSTLSRFSNAMGYSGFSSMQALFRDQYLNRPRDYLERVKKARETEEVSQDSPMAIFQDFGQANIEAMEQLQMSVSPQKLERAVSLLDGAETIYIQGMRRAYPVAFYLWYALMKSDNNVVLLDDHGGMLAPMTRRMNDKDVLVTVTFSPYAPETSSLIDTAFEKGVPIVAITDNQMTSQGSKMEVCFEVQEGEIMGFRSLSSSLYLAQTLAVSLMCQEVK
ncbi:MurR/RpiR family transcriptional regulator [Photobacterium sp. DNB23_23_1]|uniref:MurR/RpiR family transcriptional regulator n=1 Tax=Photobacterium pectinilyticum TaxID=2906793 RepID=A0ABT1N956_9GAMM|nr:MurR/RpiR family transcriptional regulator [Photobacterium sp. ZSDE20]MCQ1061280.1 MurR/RpiR family transcriptional regulator [Photobacterium sp. ZSDE20]MDD1829738.1 MurR/RpiR family transcriptional regulator [Photobacterium sp. ZSDE20]